MSEENYFAQVNWESVTPASGGGREVFANDGWHKVIIADSKGAPNSKNTGFLWTAYIKCMEGPDAGKTIDTNENVFHQNADAQRIGQERISAYCHAIGEFKPVDNHFSNGRNKPFMVRTETVEEEYTPSGKTEAVKTKRTYIRDWDRVGGSKSAQAGNASSGQTATAAPPPQNPAPAPAQANGASPSNEQQQEAPIQAGWGAPPPGAGADTGQPAAGGWGAPANAQANNGGGNKAPWNA